MGNLVHLRRAQHGHNAMFMVKFWCTNFLDGTASPEALLSELNYYVHSILLSERVEISKSIKGQRSSFVSEWRRALFSTFPTKSEVRILLRGITLNEQKSKV